MTDTLLEGNVDRNFSQKDVKKIGYYYGGNLKYTWHKTHKRHFWVEKIFLYER